MGGTDADIGTAEAVETITKGDIITVNSPPSDRSVLTQDPRTIRETVSRDTLQTTIYKGQGITAAKTPLRPVTWRKQEDDKIVDGVKVRRPVLPGDVLEMHAKITQQKRTIWRFEVRAEVEGAKVIEATLTLAQSKRKP